MYEKRDSKTEELIIMILGLLGLALRWSGHHDTGGAVGMLHALFRFMIDAGDINNTGRRIVERSGKMQK